MKSNVPLTDYRSDTNSNLPLNPVKQMRLINIMVIVLLCLKIIYDFQNLYFAQACLSLAGIYLSYRRNALFSKIQEEELENYPEAKNILDKLRTLESKIRPIVLILLGLNTLYLIRKFFAINQRGYIPLNIGLGTLLYYNRLPQPPQPVGESNQLHLNTSSQISEEAEERESIDSFSSDEDKDYNPTNLFPPNYSPPPNYENVILGHGNQFLAHNKPLPSTPDPTPPRSAEALVIPQPDSSSVPAQSQKNPETLIPSTNASSNNQIQSFRQLYEKAKQLKNHFKKYKDKDRDRDNRIKSS